MLLFQNLLQTCNAKTFDSFYPPHSFLSTYDVESQLQMGVASEKNRVNEKLLLRPFRIGRTMEILLVILLFDDESNS